MSSPTTQTLDDSTPATYHMVEGDVQKVMDYSFVDPGGTRTIPVISLDTPLTFKKGRSITERMLDAELERLEIEAIQQRVTDIEDQWGVDPSEFFVHHQPPSPTGMSEGPLPLSEEGSFSADNEEDWEATHEPSTVNNQHPSLDSSMREEVYTSSAVTEDPQKLKVPNEIRRSARLLQKTGPSSTADKTEQAEKIKSLEYTPAQTLRTDTRHDAALGSIIISNNLFAREDIDLVALASGFRYSPRSSPIAKVIGDSVANGDGKRGGTNHQ